MIALTSIHDLSAGERSQVERKELAKGAWAEGRTEDALLILGTVLAEEMTPRVAVACWVAQSAFFAELKQWDESLKALDRAAPFLDSAGPYVRACFHNQRGRAHKEIGDYDAALTDYTGTAALHNEAGNPEGEGGAFLNIAGVFLKLGDIEQARENVDKCFILLPDKSIYLGDAYDTLAQIDLADGKLESALFLIQHALDLAGTNEAKMKDFLITSGLIKTKLTNLLERLKVDNVRRALIQSDGSISRAANLLGVKHKSIDWIIEKHTELQGYRNKRRVRHKTIVK